MLELVGEANAGLPHEPIERRSAIRQLSGTSKLFCDVVVGLYLKSF